MKAIRLMLRLSRGYRLTPWRSPYLRWRMETYWGLHADQIGFSEFWTFLWVHRADTLRYLRWALSNCGIAGTTRPPGKPYAAAGTGPIAAHDPD
jgi:hypothetical protein